MDRHDMWLLTCVPNFSSLSWSELFQEPPVLKVNTWRMLMVSGFWFQVIEGSSWYVILDLLAKFQLSSPPSLNSILGRYWWFLTGDLEDEVILDAVNCHHIWFLICVPNYSSLAWLEVCQKKTHPWSPYLEDIDGSWLETWQIWSSLISWNVIICDFLLVCQISALLD